MSKDTKSYNKTEIADAIRNAFSTKIKDAVITDEYEGHDVNQSVSADKEIENIESITDFYTSDMMVTGQISKEMLEEARISEQNDEKPVMETDHAAETTDKTINDSISEPEPISDDDDMGYDISFNTTIACLITNAKMTKSQANKLASILHDAYARSIKPVHGTMDGDTIFVLTTNKAEVNFDAFAALSTDVLQYAIIDSASSAKSAYGLPAACDIIKK